MAQVSFKRSSMVVLGIGIAIIVITIGVFGWVVGSWEMKEALKFCRESGGRQEYNFGPKPLIFEIDCPRVRGLIAVYVLLIVTMIIANILGWMIVLRRWANSFRLKVCFVLFAFMAACLSICLCALYSSKEKVESLKPKGNLGIGIITLLYNLGMIALGALFILWHSSMDTDGSTTQSGATASVGVTPLNESPTPTDSSAEAGIVGSPPTDQSRPSVPVN